MTVHQLRLRMRKLREQGEEQQEEAGELNLIPYLDIVMNVIMFLLATVTFQATLSSININLPTSALASPGQTSPNPKPELNLTVSITDKGYTLATSGAVLYRGFLLLPTGVQQQSSELPTLGLREGKHDTAELTRVLGQIKDRFPDEERAILTATPQVSYDLVVQTLDAMRQAESGRVLFPGVLLGAGVN
ncbi:MAG: biopolymer transporter ExbD [Polyangia bacterium]